MDLEAILNTINWESHKNHVHDGTVIIPTIVRNVDDG